MTLRILLVCAVSTPEQSEKISIAHQRANGLAWSAKQDGDVIDIVEIPGYSRRFYTLRELSEAAARDGYHGPAQLERHIQAADFDVMWVQVTNRFNREQSLNAEIIARVIRECGARIMSDADGMIDETNYRAYIAITGYRDSTEIDELVRKRQMGIVGLAQKGLPTNGKVIMSHRLVRDGSGKAARLELREDYTALWHDLAALLLEGVAALKLEEAMFTRFGYGTGEQPYTPGKFYRLLTSPQFWGNSAIRWHRKVSQRYALGLWALDSSAAPPEGIDMFYNTHPAVYAGDLAAAVQAELRRREGVYNRFARSVKAFTGLVYCEACWWRYAYTSKKRADGTPYYYLRCNQNAQRHRMINDCNQGKVLRESDVIVWMKKQLADAIAAGEIAFAPTPRPDTSAAQLQSLKFLAAKLERRRDALIDELGDAPDEATRLAIRRRIHAAGGELQRHYEHILQLEQTVSRAQSQTADQRAAMNHIHAAGAAFWDYPPLEINQWLRRVLGSARLYARDGDVQGFFDLTELKRRNMA